MNTIYEQLKGNGVQISKKQIKEAGINPEKEWDLINVVELKCIADGLNIPISQLL